MDRVFSTRLDETIVDELNRETKRLGISKKKFLEDAIHQKIARAGDGDQADLWEETCGAWRRRGSPEATIGRARRAFEASVRRHQLPKTRSRS